MNSQVCVNCSNKKPVNQTTNRLVTESCGHVKCMDCLLVETSGCAACLRVKSLQDYEEIPDHETSLLSQCTVTITTDDSEPFQNNTGDQDKVNGADKRKKPETSHIIKIESDVNGCCYKCTFCKRRFHARSQVAYHAYCNGQSKPYQCPECDKTFATHSHFKYHMRVHRNERTYSCDVCGDSFFQMSKLQRHKLKHTSKYHMRVHRNERTCSCDVCGDSFFQMCKLQRHKLNHTKEKKFACQQCNKAFNNLSALRKHGLTHTQEKPHGCDTCGQRFRDRSNYRKHAAKHISAKHTTDCTDPTAPTTPRTHERRAFQCPRCPQAFRSKKDMRRHSAVHSDSKPFRCKVCDRRFRRKDNLERHIRNTHPDHVTSSAIDFDGQDHPPIDNGATVINEVVYENVEKTKLEILNPLPPLSPDVIQTRLPPKLDIPVIEKIKYPIKKEMKKTFIETSYILEANNARESVICVNKKEVLTAMKKEEWSDGHEYVHKIKKPTYWARDKDVSLPPVDAGILNQFLDRKDDISNDDVVAPKNTEIYKKFFFDDKGNNAEGVNGREVQDNEVRNTGAEVHWRKKKLNITW